MSRIEQPCQGLDPFELPEPPEDSSTNFANGFVMGAALGSAMVVVFTVLMLWVRQWMQ